MVGVITDQQVGPLENRPKLGQLFFKVAAIGIGCRIMSTNAGNGKRGRVVGPGIGKKLVVSISKTIFLIPIIIRIPRILNANSANKNSSFAVFTCFNLQYSYCAAAADASQENP